MKRGEEITGYHKLGEEVIKRKEEKIDEERVMWVGEEKKQEE